MSFDHVDRIVMRTGEALVEGTRTTSCAEPEVRDPAETRRTRRGRLATLMGDQVKGHTKVFAILGSDVQVRPATVMVSKVTVPRLDLHQHPHGHRPGAAIANGVLDAVRAGDIPRDKVNDLGIIYSVWLDPSVTKADASTTRQAASPCTAKPPRK